MEENKALTLLENAFADFGGVQSMIDDVRESEVDRNKPAVNDFDGFFAEFDATNRDYNDTPWTYDEGKTSIHPDSKWVVDIKEFYHGWMGFQKTAGAEGKPIPGKRPDQLWTLWNKPYPEADPERPWMTPAYKFNATCIYSPDSDQVGVMVQLADSRAMSRGFGTLERALRARVKRIGGYVQESKPEEAQALAQRMYPVIEFGWRHQVKTRMGHFNAIQIRQFKGEEGWIGLKAPKDPPKQVEPPPAEQPAEPATTGNGQRRRRRRTT